MVDWDYDSPSDNDLVSQFPANERAAREAVAINFSRQHVADGGGEGMHTYVTLLNMGAEWNPPPMFNGLTLFTRRRDGYDEVFLRDEYDNEIQLTTHVLDPDTNLPKMILSIDLEDLPNALVVGSLRTKSYFRGTVQDLGEVSGTVVLDWEGQTTYRMTVVDDVVIELVNMPPAGEDQVMYFDFTMDGDHMVDVSSSYTLLGAGGHRALTPGGRDFLVAATCDGTNIVLVPINDLQESIDE